MRLLHPDGILALEAVPEQVNDLCAHPKPDKAGAWRDSLKARARVNTTARDLLSLAAGKVTAASLIRSDLDFGTQRYGEQLAVLVQNDALLAAMTRVDTAPPMLDVRRYERVVHLHPG